ncbi:MAG: hypothetical protein IGR92_07165 [Leptolyngbyaceae cyanobacterium T60_A2020_046]|nr:hypothetical protein [Leptolyngbyaceae cyanobacterium T60_A2020_046]
MTKFDTTQLRARFDNTSEGWLVQVYRSDRRLLCVLEASHAWAFFVGCGLGLLLAVGWFNLAKSSPSTLDRPITIPPEMWID